MQKSDIIDRRYGFAGQPRPGPGGNHGPVLRRQVVDKRLLLHFCRAISQNVGHGSVHELEHLVLDNDYPILRLLHRSRILLLRLSQRLLRPLALGDVATGAEDQLLPAEFERPG